MWQIFFFVCTTFNLLSSPLVLHKAPSKQTTLINFRVVTRGEKGYNFSLTFNSPGRQRYEVREWGASTKLLPPPPQYVLKSSAGPSYLHPFPEVSGRWGEMAVGQQWTFFSSRALLPNLKPLSCVRTMLFGIHSQLVREGVGDLWKDLLISKASFINAGILVLWPCHASFLQNEYSENFKSIIYSSEFFPFPFLA